MHTNRLLRIVGGAALALVPALAGAHPGHGAEGVLQGAMHPLTGADHLLVMLAVGAWAAYCGGRMVWQLPLAFVALLGVGALGAQLAGAGSIPGALEQALAASVVVSGLLLAFATRAPAAASFVLCGAFALLHGYAHGAEAPAGSIFAYGIGFLAGSVALHAAGAALTLLAIHRGSRLMVRAGGGAMALCGLAMLAA